MKKLILIDGQVFQSPAWHRGMGKYSYELVRSLHDFGKEQDLEIRVVLSSKSSSDPDMLKRMEKLLGSPKLVFLNLLPNEIGNPSVVEKNRAMVDEYVSSIDGKFTDINFLILSLMQGEICPAFPSTPSIKKLVLLYDLIPLMFHDVYLRNPITRMEYLAKIKELLGADHYLAISETVANDLAIYLGVAGNRVTSIDGGPIDHSTISKPLDIAEPFVLMPTGNDLRKNNRRGIAGFQQFNDRHGNRYKLVITSFFKEHEVLELQKLSPHVIFSGNVSGEELSFLYEKSEALLFPPEYEGLGLPILEAVEHNKPIACSNIAVFREMSDTAFSYFDPRSITEISYAIERAVEGKIIDADEYKKILKKYTWENTTKKTIRAIATTKPKVTKRNKALAIFLPDPATNEIAKITLNNHAEACRVADINYFVAPTAAGSEKRVNFLPYIAPVTELQQGFKYAADNYEQTVFHLGNHKDFSKILFTALGAAGTVVLHSTSLEKAWKQLAREKLIHTTRLQLEEKLNKLSGDDGYLSSVLHTAQKVLAMDTATYQKCKELIDAGKFKTMLVRAPMPVSGLPYVDALPAKTIVSRRASDYTSKLTDYNLNTERGKLRYVLFDEGGEQQLLEYMRLGIIPVVESWKDIPENAKPYCLKQTFADEVYLDEATYISRSKEAISFVAQHELQLEYLEKLNGLIQENSDE